MTTADERQGRFRTTLVTAAIAVCFSGCATARSEASVQTRAQLCPTGTTEWVRWNDSKGLNVVAIVNQIPGWTFEFEPRTTLINSDPGFHSEVELTLRPRRARTGQAGAASDHIYGYWPHAVLGAKPNFVTVRCGRTVLGRYSVAPRDWYNPDPPPTVPPPPPPRP